MLEMQDSSSQGLGIRALLPGGSFYLGGQSHSDQSVMGLEFLHGFRGIVDECEAGGLAATILGTEAEDGDLVLACLVHG